MPDNILTKDRSNADLDIAAKDVLGVKVPRNIIVDPSGNDMTVASETTLSDVLAALQSLDAKIAATQPVSGPATNAELRSAPIETNGVGDWLIRRLSKAIGRMSFDATNQLRVAPANIAAVTTVTTVGTGNMGMGDAGKPATAMLFTRQLTTASTRRNLIRT